MSDIDNHCPSPVLDKDLLVSQIMSHQETVKDLLLRLAKAKESHDKLQAENDMLVKYIHNLKSTTAEIKCNN